MGANNVSAWTPERRADLAKLCEEGLSASQIAARLGGGITRNAVISMIARSGLKLRGQPHYNVTKRAPKAAKAAPVIAPPPVAKAAPDAPPVYAPPAPIRAAVAPPSAKTLLQLGDNECRWPLDPAPGSDEVLFCCDPVAGFDGDRPSRSYCACHRDLAFRAGSGRKKTPTEPSIRSYGRAA